jgi:hypothetical protein
MGKKPKKRDSPSVASSTDGSFASKSSNDRRKSVIARAKSDGGILSAMKNSLQIASDEESEASEKDDDDDEGPGLLSRGLNRLEQFYEEALNG